MKENNDEVKFKISKKQWIIIGVSLVILISIGVLIGFKTKNNNSNGIDDSSLDGNKISADLFGFNCVLADNTGKEQNKDVSVYGKGEYLLCNIEMSYNYDKSISDIEFDFVSKDIKLLNVYSINDDWDTEFDVIKDGVFVSITSQTTIKTPDIKDVKFHLHIKANKTLEIDFKDIKISAFDTDTNDYIKEKIISIKKGNNRYYKENDSIIFEKLQKDGSFKKINEYKCSSSSFNNCSINIASESFTYKNENKNVIMISDDNYTTTVMFDIEKGVIGTYGGDQRWLYSSKYNNQGGTYIYLKAKNSNKYGIIDANGKVIHEFNLGHINALVPTGILDTVYSIENDMIVDEKDGKFGISKITSNDLVFDYNFDSIRFIVDVKEILIEEDMMNSYMKKIVNNKYFKAKLDDKWYLYSFDTKDKVIDEGYDNLFVVNDEIIVVEKDKQLYIKDYEGNDLVEDKIEDLSNEYLEYVCCLANPGIEVSVKNNIITIKTYKDNNWEDYNHFEYNISKKILIDKTEKE